MVAEFVESIRKVKSWRLSYVNWYLRMKLETNERVYHISQKKEFNRSWKQQKLDKHQLQRGQICSVHSVLQANRFYSVYGFKSLDSWFTELRNSLIGECQESRKIVKIVFSTNFIQCSVRYVNRYVYMRHMGPNY